MSWWRKQVEAIRSREYLDTLIMPWPTPELHMNGTVLDPGTVYYDKLARMERISWWQQLEIEFTFRPHQLELL